MGELPEDQRVLVAAFGVEALQHGLASLVDTNNGDYRGYTIAWLTLEGRNKIARINTAYIPNDRYIRKVVVPMAGSAVAFMGIQTRNRESLEEIETESVPEYDAHVARSPFFGSPEWATLVKGNLQGTPEGLKLKSTVGRNAFFRGKSDYGRDSELIAMDMVHTQKCLVDLMKTADIQDTMVHVLEPLASLDMAIALMLRQGVIVGTTSQEGDRLYMGRGSTGALVLSTSPNGYFLDSKEREKGDFKQRLMTSLNNPHYVEFEELERGRAYHAAGDVKRPELRLLRG